MKNLFTIILSMFAFCTMSFGQSDSYKPVDLVTEVSKTQTAKTINPFTLNTSRDAKLPEELQNFDLFEVDLLKLGEVLQSDNNELISISLPSQTRNTLNLKLVEVNIHSNDGYVNTMPSGETVKVSHGKHFRGVVKGDSKSIVAISIFEDEIMGLISESGKPNLVLGRLEGQETHVLYEDTDLKDQLGFSCDTPDIDFEYSEADLKDDNKGSRALSDCVRIYLEVDNDIYQDKGSNVTSVTNFITGLFNQVATMYANEQINVVLSPLTIWTQSSPYSSSTSSGMLNQFLANTGSFDGDLAQLLSYQASGGIAYVDQLCSSNPDYSKSFSSIDPTYQNVPTYSWSVMVITHEFGHLFGSSHTHACAWNGNNTAIDGCYTTEGSCADPGNPAGGGTVMSYCHLTSVGINLNLGFGPQPGNLIRNRVTNASCTQACSGGGPTCTDGVQNGSETGVDCGGPDCAPCSSGCSDTEATLTIVLDNYPGETTWTVKNAGGSTLYSGGPYSTAGSTVFVDFCLADGCYDFQINDSYGDGICCGYGQGSYDISIGGQSVASGGQFTSVEIKNFCAGGGVGPTCTDGVQNGSETGVDCGGPDCAACPTCNDGIQNGSETGVDCGGPDCAPCGGGGDTEIFAHYFETGWDGWQDGGSDCYRYNGSRSYEGNRSIRIRDNSGTASAMTSASYNTTAYSGVEVNFYFYSYSMENGEDFWVRYYDGSSWQTVATFARGTNFENNTFYVATVPILASNYNMSANSRFRFQCDASANADHIYIDAVTVTGLGSGNLPSGEIEIKSLRSMSENEEFSFIEDIHLSPNPASNDLRVRLNIDYDQNVKLEVIDILGRAVITQSTSVGAGLVTIPVDIEQIKSGTYFLRVTDTEGDHMMDKFIKIR